MSSNTGPGSSIWIVDASYVLHFGAGRGAMGEDHLADVPSDTAVRVSA